MNDIQIQKLPNKYDIEFEISTKIMSHGFVPQIIQYNLVSNGYLSGFFTIFFMATVYLRTTEKRADHPHSPLPPPLTHQYSEIDL